MKPSRKKRWVAKGKTDSTHPPEGLFTKSATTIARGLASKKVSPKGPASGLRMLTYFINRGGRGLASDRRAELEKAKALLSKRVHRLIRDDSAVVLALPRGGVPVGFEVAQALHADLDIFLVRKLGVPGHEEVAMGAIASGGIRVLKHTLIAQLGLT